MICAKYKQSIIEEWMKVAFSPFRRKTILESLRTCDLSFLTLYMQKFIILYFLIVFHKKLRIFLKKNQEDFRRNQFTTSQILNIYRIIEKVSKVKLSPFS